uniref:Uncharacterized protein n=1 Tax=Scleropages formosus TaxID=113540 RepID=A0A8C9TU88_SCLFO
VCCRSRLWCFLVGYGPRHAYQGMSVSGQQTGAWSQYGSAQTTPSQVGYGSSDNYGLTLGQISQTSYGPGQTTGTQPQYGSAQTVASDLGYGSPASYGSSLGEWRCSGLCSTALPWQWCRTAATCRHD